MFASLWMPLAFVLLTPDTLNNLVVFFFFLVYTCHWRLSLRFTFRISRLGAGVVVAFVSVGRIFSWLKGTADLGRLRHGSLRPTRTLTIAPSTLAHTFPWRPPITSLRSPAVILKGLRTGHQNRVLYIIKRHYPPRLGPGDHQSPVRGCQYVSIRGVCRSGYE